MGQRYVQLASTYTAYQSNNTAVLQVSQLPPNPAIIAPGPALIFVVVNGVPSIGMQVMLGSGQLGNQTILAASSLPTSTMVQDPAKDAKPTEGSDTAHSGVAVISTPGGIWNAGMFIGLVALLFL